MSLLCPDGTNRTNRRKVQNSPPPSPQLKMANSPPGLGTGEEGQGCSVALSSCVADMSDTFRLIICVVVSSNENAL